MNDTQSQFIAICPGCSASLMVAFDRLGQHIACTQCRRTFVAGEASLEGERPEKRPAVPVKDANVRVDRIDAVCTNCNATLRVRRAYIGNDVRCKFCDQVFRVRATAGTQATTEPDEPDPRLKALQAQHARLTDAHDLLQADHERLKTEYAGLLENLRCATNELESIHAALGTVTPEEVGSLANDRQSLGEKVDRLQDEIRSLLVAQEDRDQLVGENQRWVSELDLVRAERDRLAEQLRDRDDQLEGLRAQVAEQRRRIDESEQIHREMAEALAGMGIRCWPTRV